MMTPFVEYSTIDEGGAITIIHDVLSLSWAAQRHQYELHKQNLHF